MLYVIIERFRDGNAIPVYRRFRDRERLAFSALRYISGSVIADLQVMECDDRALFDAWMAQRSDLVDLEVEMVVTFGGRRRTAAERRIRTDSHAFAENGCESANGPFR